MTILQIDDDTTIDQVFERMDKAREEAASRVQPFQAEFKPGDFFIRLEQVDVQVVIAIYGKVLGCYEEPRLEHYRSCRCYSKVVPEGELGDVHVSVMQRKLSPSQFNLAQEWGFPSDARVRKIVGLQ